MHDSHSEKKDRLGYGPDTSVVTNQVRISFVKLNSAEFGITNVETSL